MSAPGHRPPRHLGLGSMLGEVDPFADVTLGDARSSNAHASRCDCCMSSVVDCANALLSINDKVILLSIIHIFTLQHTSRRIKHTSNLAPSRWAEFFDTCTDVAIAGTGNVFKVGR